MTEATRLVDELTTLLYEVVKRWQLQDGRVCEIVACGACRRKADRAESVVHDSDCPVYRLIRANATLQSQLAALEQEREFFERNAYQATEMLADEYGTRKAAEAERDAALARAEADRAALQACVGAISAGVAELPTGGMTGGGERPYSETWRNFDRALRMARVALAAAAPGEGESPTWPHVMAFAKRMEGKLAKNRHKGDRAGWLADHPGDLLRRIRDEANELENAILSDHSSEDVWQEAADVANFALMVADSYAARQEGGDE